MTPWAKWTAKTVLLATGFAAAGGGLPGVAFAGAAGAAGANAGNASLPGGIQVGADKNGASASIPTSVEPHRASMSAGNLSIGSGNDVPAPVSAPAGICGNAAAVLGDSSAGCAVGATVGERASHSSGKAHRKATSKVGRTRKTSKTGESRRRTSRPTKTQLAGLGVLPGIATVPGLGDVTSLSPLAGLADGGALMPASTLSAYQQTYQERALPGTADGGRSGDMGGGMSGNSFAALAIGALLAGAAALKLASRRPRDRRTRAGQVSA